LKAAPRAIIYFKNMGQENS